LNVKALRREYKYRVKRRVEHQWLLAACSKEEKAVASPLSLFVDAGLAGQQRQIFGPPVKCEAALVQSTQV
jgi:hypothetical protein